MNKKQLKDWKSNDENAESHSDNDREGQADKYSSEYLKIGITVDNDEKVDKEDNRG